METIVSEGRRERVLGVLLIPRVERARSASMDQNPGTTRFGNVQTCNLAALAYPKAMGSWRDGDVSPDMGPERPTIDHIASNRTAATATPNGAASTHSNWAWSGQQNWVKWRSITSAIPKGSYSGSASTTKKGVPVAIVRTSRSPAAAHRSPYSVAVRSRPPVMTSMLMSIN